MSNLFKDITSTLKETFKGKKGMPENSTQNAPEISSNSKQNASEQTLNLFNAFFGKIEGVLFSLQPKIYSMAKESNIMCKYDDNLIITKDFNVCMGIKLKGISYAAVNESEELELAINRNRFFTRLDDSIEMNIIAKKELSLLENDTSTIKNLYAKEVIEKWDKKINVYETSYYLIFSTKTKHIAGFFESIKEKTTTEQEDKNQNTALHLKAKRLIELKTNLMSDLSSYKPKLMNADELLNLFASYANMQKTNLKYSHKLITDCYISSNVEFKKDYIIFHQNNNQTKYARFISIKAYETESITSLIATSILRENSQYTLFLSCEAIPKDKAVKKVKEIKAFTQDAFKDELEFYIQELKSERENMIMVSYSVLVEVDNLDELDEQSDIIKGLLENQGVIAVKETLNQNPLYFSFFPSRGNLNARKRSLQGRNLAALATFENDILGLPKNAWGNCPVTTFKHLSGSPFLFNFHDSIRVGAAGHTLVIGGTGYGKTTLMQFLMMNLFKYDINIFAMDKSQGMFNFTKYMGAEYHDFTDENKENNFKLNPFSLKNSDENNLFLLSWLCKMGNINASEKSDEIELDEKGEIFIIRAFPVFNVAQCENINLEKLNELKIKNNITDQKFEKLKFSPNPFIEKIFENSGIEFKFGGDEAFYHAKQDFIQLPLRENFKSISGFYSTALHELGHATGHHTRLNRDLSGAFGSQSYALEELRAETYSFIQSFDLGIELNLENHASYLDSWAKTASTQNGKDEIRKAIKDALEINKFVKAQWYPKDMSLDFTKTIQEDKTTNLHHTTIKPKSQESTQASIANKNYSMGR